jgi:hypothetical protein
MRDQKERKKTREMSRSKWKKNKTLKYISSDSIASTVAFFLMRFFFFFPKEARKEQKSKIIKTKRSKITRTGNKKKKKQAKNMKFHKTVVPSKEICFYC